MSPQITAKDVEDYVSQFEWFRHPDRQGYWAAAKDRLVTTLNLIPRLPNPERVRVLEIGGMPYFMTALIEKLFGYKVEVINEPTWERGEDGNVEVLESDHGDRHEIHYRTLNIEYDPWPWEDGLFDIVLYCEVIEHLVYDPTRTLVEAHRVLKKDTGKLLISTPNALAYPYLLQMIRGVNFYPPYSGYSHYARHHRLFSPEELVKLCTMVGYQVHTCYSVYDRAYAHPRRLDPVVRALMGVGKLKRRLDVIYLLATPVGEPRWAYPDSPPHAIYDDTQGYRSRVPLSTIRMVDQESSPLLSGFFRVEAWGGGVRWTGPKAQLVLRRRGHDKVSVSLYTGIESRGPEVEGWIGVGGEAAGEQGLQRHEFTLPSGSWETLTFPLPADTSDRVLIEIGVNRPMVPNELDPKLKDGRQLGVAVREVALL
jgi:SAM-dependent methyltransferase